MKSEQRTAEELKKEETRRADQDRVKRRVLAILGEPPDLVRVTVTHVSGGERTNSYRVNVYVRDKQKGDLLNMIQSRMAHSYFVLEDKETDLLNADPPLTRVYGKPEKTGVGTSVQPGVLGATLLPPTLVIPDAPQSGPPQSGPGKRKSTRGSGPGSGPGRM